MRKQSNLSLATSTEKHRREQPAISHDTLLAATSQIVSAFIAGRTTEHFNLTELTAQVYGTLCGLARGEFQVQGTSRKPSVPLEDSVKADYLVCLEDGKRVKMLKRYLKSNYNLSPEEYRARWNLPASYPMVAPNYAKVRSALAKKIGLGRRGIPAVAKRIGSDRAGLR